MMLSRKLVLAAAAALSLTGSVARADVISTLSSWTGSVGGTPASGNNFAAWGTSPAGTPTYGETFTVPAGDTTLTSLTTEVATISGAPIGYKLAIYAWTGSATTGSAVYSGTGSIPASSTFEALTTNLTGTTVTPGSKYVFYYTTVGLSEPSATAAFGAIFPAATAGTFVYNNDVSLNNADWNSVNASLAFSLTLSPAVSGVPEPSTWALLTVASLAGVGGVLRRNRKVSATV
jgi:hypothetical protein